MKDCFLNEIQKTVTDIKSTLGKDDYCFALLTDTRLSDTSDDTVENIKAVDKEVCFDALIHLGNFINGDNPEKISRYLFNVY